MSDATAARRVRRYREAQKGQRGIVRVEVQVPAWAAAGIKAEALRVRERVKRLTQAERAVALVLGTVNAPRPRELDAETLLACLLARRPLKEWSSHIAALFDEVSPEAMHDLVLVGLVDFEELYRAARTWKIINGRNLPWITEMAALRLARPPALGHRTDGDPAG